MYDSLGLIPSPDLKRQIAAIVCSVSKCIKITVKAVQKQLPSSNDCGVLAIAFAVSLVMGKDPTIISYDSVQIRKHLKMCLESGVFTPFPETSKRILRVKEQTFACAIYCTCRMPYFNDVKSAGMRMAQCGKCSEWIHKDCGKIPEAAFSHKTYNYVCKNCISYQK